MNMSLRDRWWATWQTLGVEDAAKVRLEETYGALMARYGEPHRHYHTEQHLMECFDRWDQARSPVADPGALALALWFHDGIYDPRRSDNEARSGAWMAAVAIAAGIDSGRVAWAGRAIAATAHGTIHPQDDGMGLLLDLDLGILAAGRDRFADYCQQIRREYCWVPGEIYGPKRRQVLQSFLDRPAIFWTREYRDRHEAQARDNLQWEIARLMGTF
ncbi:MAG: metal-dependent hydrolase [Cyanophyceae cyanobacterium]